MRDVCYKTVVKRYGTLQNVMKVLQKHYGELQSITEHHRALRDVTEIYASDADRYGILRERYEALMERYGTVTENIAFADH